MKHIILSLVLLFGTLSAFSNDHERTNPFDLNATSENTALSVPCVMQDSLALVALFNATAGNSWTNRWFMNTTPVCSWYGITMNAAGRVIEVQLGSNFLWGFIPPEIGDLTAMEVLELDANRLSNILPSTIGNCTALKTLWIDNNEISGGLPSSIGNLVNLQSLFIDDNNMTLPLPDECGDLVSLMTFFLDNNEIPGPLPESMKDLPNLSRLELFNNHIDSLPDLSMLSIPNNRLKYQNNRLTFDDVLPNVGPSTGIYYAPQDSIGTASTQNVTTGSFYTFDLDIDHGISDNQYEWFRDGMSIATTNSNQFVLGPIDFTDAGVYTCEVTNMGALLLTLYSRPITLVIACGTSVFNMRDTLCPGSEVLVNGTTYNELMPSGIENLGTIDQYGCDSVINVDLSFMQPPVDTFAALFCPGETIDVNGTLYGPGMPTGTEVFEDAIGPGCDSTVFVDLTFIDNADLTENFSATICPDSSIWVNGNEYNFLNPFGIEFLEDSSFYGCDSLVTIFLQFYPEIVTTFDPMICGTDSFTINGTIYHQGNPTGVEIFENVTSNGCDSTVNINIQYASEVITPYTDTLCPDGEIIVNGTPYNFSNPTGSETFPGVLPGGCDSTVTINLNFHPTPMGTYSEVICPGTSTIINGETFDAGNLSSMQTIADASQFACDSLVDVSISFFLPATGTYTTTICPEDSIEVNGTFYSATNSNGLDTLFGGSQNGCDSIVDVTINFWPAAIGNYTDELCASGSVVINGTIYDINTPSGTEILTDASQHFCDSTVIINLTFTDDPGSTFAPTWCSDQSIVIDGTTYDAGNPTGQETVPSIASPGCDSIIDIAINFIPNDTTLYNPQFCPGGSVVVNGNVYDIGTPNGQEVLTSNITGCDSVVNVALTFGSQILENYNPTFCFGDSVTINGTVYNAGNPTGSEPFPGQGQGGCDSTLLIDITFLTEAIGNYTPTVCENDTFEINGVIFDINSPTGQVILPGVANGGCDSTLNVDLSFFPTSAPGNYNPTICESDSLEFNGIFYHIGNTTGTEILIDADQNGCDSTVNISLSFYPPALGNYEPTICEGDSVIVNGTVYDFINRTGTETLIDAAENGCDSILSVKLSFFAPVSGTYAPTLCTGDNVVINGNVYDAATPNGTEVLENAAQNGCDSTVMITLSFNNVAIIPIGGFLCFGDSAIVNGIVYNAANPSGMDTISNGGSCDSILNVNYFFYDEALETVDDVYCDPITITVGTQTFGPANPQGTVLLEDASINGCDSIVVVNLTYYLDNDSTITDTYCPGDSLVVGTEVFNSSMPNGVVILPGAAQGGCDSTVNVNLTFLQVEDLTELVDDVLCAEDSLLVNGTWYHQGNPTGIETLVGGSAEGCDSIVDIRLTFLAPVSGTFIDSFCEGATFEINGTIYDINNPTGVELLENASVQGCDSLVTITLTFDQNIQTSLDTTICQGMTLLVGTEEISNAGTSEVTIMSNSGCDSIVTVTLNFDDPFAAGTASAGIDDVSCEEASLISANLSAGQVGFWSSTGTAIVDHINQAETGVSNLEPGDNTFIWTVSTAFCPEYDQESVTITYYPLPEPRADSFFIQSGINLFELDLLANDSFPEGVESPFLLEVNLDAGGLIMQEDTLVEFIPQLGFDGLATGTYSICGTFCPDFCLEAPFEIEIAGRGDTNQKEWDVPNGFTPNNDGTNDVLILDPLLENPELFENNELMIFNRWGNIVYKAAPYFNDWNGVGPNGKPLPEGTYYYVLRLDLNSGQIYKGDITILR